MDMINMMSSYDALITAHTYRDGNDPYALVRGEYEGFLEPPTEEAIQQRQHSLVGQSYSHVAPIITAHNKCVAGWWDVVAAQQINARRKMVGFEPFKIGAHVIPNFLTNIDLYTVAVIHAVRANFMSPLEVAKALQQLLEPHPGAPPKGYTQRQVCALWGQTQPWVCRKLQLLELPPTLQHLVHVGEMKEDAALLLNHHPEEVVVECVREARVRGVRPTSHFVASFLQNVAA